jgi:nucleoid DNA-binding protein
MYEILYKYLILNNKIGLPGIGSFFIESAPAKMNIVTNTLIAPARLMSFTAEEDSIDNRFYEYLSRELQLNEVEAAMMFNQFSNELRGSVINGGVSLPGLGTLQKNNEGTLIFIEEKKSDILWPEIKINNTTTINTNLFDVYDSGETKIITQEGIAPLEEKITREEDEDYWWVWAIILALCGIGALLYYYI